MIPTSSTSVSRCEVRARGSERSAAGAAPSWRGPSSIASRSTSAVWRPTGGQASSLPTAPASAAHLLEPSGSSSRSMTASANAVGVVEGHEHAGAGAEQVLGVEVRRRDDGAAGDDRERQRAGDDLLARPVRREVDGRSRTAGRRAPQR